MDLNFELILTVCTLVCGLFWIIDRFLKSSSQIILFFGSLAPILLFVLILRSFVVEPFQIPSRSMVPTLVVGDFILVSKWNYSVRLPVLRTELIEVSAPKRGDVIVFFPPHESRYFIKRLIGLPGDRVNLIDGTLYINNEVISENTISTSDFPRRTAVIEESIDKRKFLTKKHNPPGRLSKNYSIVVPKDHYFVMGDYRDNSSDSRIWGPVPKDRIVGKAFARWMFWDEFFSLPSFHRVGSIN